MSITINLYYSGSNGNARKFVEEMERSGIADKVRKEDGNIRYDYFYPINDSETVLLIDSWTSQKSIDLHHESSMMEEIAELRIKYDLHMKAERYLSDEAGIPPSDKAFLKEQFCCSLQIPISRYAILYKEWK